MCGCGCNCGPGAICYIVEPVADPVISPASTSFYGSVTVSITCATQNAVIHYTTDGSTPTASSAIYTGPFSVTDTTTVKAIALLQYFSPSNVVKAVYTEVVPTNRVYWGFSPNQILTGPQVNALQNSSVEADPYRIYPFNGGSTVNDYFFFWWPDYFAPPRPTDGFRDVTNIAPIVMAEAPEGLNSGNQNGWWYKSVTVNTIPGKLWRSFFQLGGGGLFEIECLPPSVIAYRTDSTSITSDTTTLTADFAY